MLSCLSCGCFIFFPFFLCGFPTNAVFSYGYILLYIFMKDVFGYASLVSVVTVFLFSNLSFCYYDALIAFTYMLECNMCS